MGDLSKTETRILTEASARDGLVTLPETLKPSTRERLIGRLVRDGLVAVDENSHRLRPAGYRAIGLRPPRAKKVGVGSDGTEAEPRLTKNEIVLELLGRADGASLGELIAATGWLPHTTRAALSRIRSAGRPLSKSTRDEGVTAYRLIAAPVRRWRLMSATLLAVAVVTGEVRALMLRIPSRVRLSAPRYNFASPLTREPVSLKAIPRPRFNTSCSR